MFERHPLLFNNCSMKRIFTLLLACVLLTAVSASPIEEEDAAKVAQSFLKGKRIVPVLVETSVKPRSSHGALLTPYYIYNAEDDGGFVIVSGCDELPAVVGYSDKGNFDTSRINPALADYLQSYACYVQDVLEGKAMAHAEEEMREPTIIVPALCKTVWSQEFPFNYYCPKDKNETCPVGCVATAMSQIMYYWKWPLKGRGSVNYESSAISKIYKLDLSGSEYLWTLMKTNASSGVIKKNQQEAMGQICFDAGMSVSMQYGAGGSGAFSEGVPQALVNHFSYKASTIKSFSRDCISTLDEWKTLLKNELLLSRPIYYAASSSSAGGHAFILDGFDSNDYFHVNWGWGGFCDGYYDLALSPREQGYSFDKDQKAIIGIIPDEGGEDVAFPQQSVRVKEIVSDTISIGRNDEILVKVNNVYNLSLQYHSITFGIGLYDESGNFLENITVESKNKVYNFNPLSDPFYARIDGIDLIDMYAKIPTKYGNGAYALRLTSQDKGFGEWIYPETIGGPNKNWIPVVIKDGKIFLNSPDGPTSIENIEGVISESVNFDLQGRNIANPSKGTIYINKVSYSDGTIKVTKCIAK